MQIFEEIIDNLEDIAKSYKSLFNETIETTHPIYKYKMQHFSTILKRKHNVVAKFTRNLISEIVDSKTNEILRIIFKMVNAYNKMLDLDHDISETSVNVFCNDCPSLLEPLKKFSVTRILQVRICSMFDRRYISNRIKIINKVNCRRYWRKIVPRKRAMS